MQQVGSLTELLHCYMYKSQLHVLLEETPHHKWTNERVASRVGVIPENMKPVFIDLSSFAHNKHTDTRP